MADNGGSSRAGARSGRERIQKLAQAALNADVTVDQVDAVLAGLAETLVDLDNSTGNLDATLERFNDTINRINELAPRLIAVVERLEGVVSSRRAHRGHRRIRDLTAGRDGTAVRGAVNKVRRAPACKSWVPPDSCAAGRRGHRPAVGRVGRRRRRPRSLRHGHATATRSPCTAATITTCSRSRPRASNRSTGLPRRRPARASPTT